MFSKSRLMTIGLALVALAIVNRIPQTRQLIDG